MIANGPVSTFTPIIVSGFGYSPLNSLLLSMPGGAVSGTVELCACYAALRFHNSRTWIIVICQLATVLARLLLWQLPRNDRGGLLFAIYILASFGGSYAVVMGLAMANAAGYTKRSISSAGLFLGTCSNSTGRSAYNIKTNTMLLLPRILHWEHHRPSRFPRARCATLFGRVYYHVGEISSWCGSCYIISVYLYFGKTKRGI